MKKGLVMIVFILLAWGLRAQTFSEWFRQKKTQKKYLIEQIAALKVYGEFAAKGYKIGREGLGLIGRIKDGEFNLHRDFFGSLKYANPELRKYPRVIDIVQLQQQIMTVSSSALKVLQQSSFSRPDELAYCKSVFYKLYQDCNQDLTMLENLIGTKGELTMTDDERIKRIDALYTEMEQKRDFTRSFSNSILLLVGSREREQKEAIEIKKLQDIK